ncbi:MAG: molybdopterin-dependent oxidoreductase [Bacteroidota bacterium]
MPPFTLNLTPITSRMSLERRDFLKLLGSAGVATVLPGCTPKKPQSLIPYVIPHEEIVPGKSVWYAGVCRECPAGCGIHVRVRDGRAVKVEGNPLHPVNRGSLCARGQASLQGLYNPDRIQHPLRKRLDGSWEQLTWEEAEEWLAERLAGIRREGRGSGVTWMGSHTTGSLDALIDEFLASLGSRRRLRYEPIAFESLKQANQISFGRPEIPSYDFASAKFILSFGADFLETWLSPVGYAKEYAAVREFDGTSIVKTVYVGPRLSMTATNTDEWIAPRPGTEHLLALGLVHTIITQNLHRISPSEAGEILRVIGGFSPNTVADATEIPAERLNALARDFASARPPLAVGGGTVLERENGVETLIAVNLLNYVCGAVGQTVRFDRPQAISSLNSYAEVTRFVQSALHGDIPALFFSDVNPVYATPPAANFAQAMEKIPLTVALSGFMDETTATASLVLPILTPLESWGDYEPVPGVRGVMQPAMQPVFRNARMLGDELIGLKDRISGRVTLSDSEQPLH